MKKSYLISISIFIVIYLLIQVSFGVIGKSEINIDNNFKKFSWGMFYESTTFDQQFYELKQDCSMQKFNPKEFTSLRRFRNVKNFHYPYDFDEHKYNVKELLKYLCIKSPDSLLFRVDLKYITNNHDYEEEYIQLICNIDKYENCKNGILE